MKRAGRLQTRLILVFLAVTVLPLGLTLWVSIELLNRSVDLSPIAQFDELSRAYEKLARDSYVRSRERLKQDVARGDARPDTFALAARATWPAGVSDFWDSGAPERFDLSGNRGNRLDLLVRRPAAVQVYHLDLGAVQMDAVTEQYGKAREAVEGSQARDLRKGLVWALVAVSAAVWMAGLAALVYWAHRLGRPVHELTKAMASVAGGDFSRRLDLDRDDEIGEAVRAFNEMAAQLQQSRDKLIHVTRLASWQALARKTAHEVKNSLTPIRLTMEEIIARQDGSDPFLVQAAQIAIDEVSSLERRVRAFSEFASEPPVEPGPVELNAAVEDRISLLKAANAWVAYQVVLSPDNPVALADPDLVKGVLTNLLENAAQAAGEGGSVLVRTVRERGRAVIEVHDSGPGLSPQARATIFEPTISFKKGGMGLGLSIARKSAVLCGGDIVLIEGELGGAGFRVVLPEAVPVRTAVEATARGGAA